MPTTKFLTRYYQLKEQDLKGLQQLLQEESDITQAQSRFMQELHKEAKCDAALPREVQGVIEGEEYAQKSLSDHVTAALEKLEEEEDNPTYEQIKSLLAQVISERALKGHLEEDKTISAVLAELESSEEISAKDKHSLERTLLPFNGVVRGAMRYSEDIRKQGNDSYTGVLMQVNQRIKQLQELSHDLDQYQNKLEGRIESLQKHIAELEEKLGKIPSGQAEQRAALQAEIKQNQQHVQHFKACLEQAKHEDNAAIRADISDGLKYLQTIKQQLEYRASKLQNPMIEDVSDFLVRQMEEIEDIAKETRPLPGDEMAQQSPQHQAIATLLRAPLAAVVRNQLAFGNKNSDEPHLLPTAKPEEFGEAAKDSKPIKDFCQLINELNAELDALNQLDRLVAGQPQRFENHQASIQKHHQQCQDKIKQLADLINKDMAHSRSLLAQHPRINEITAGAAALKDAVQSPKNELPIIPVISHQTPTTDPIPKGKGVWYELQKTQKTNPQTGKPEPETKLVRREVPKATRSQHQALIAEMNQRLAQQGRPERLVMVPWEKQNAFTRAKRYLTKGQTHGFDVKVVGGDGPVSKFIRGTDNNRPRVMQEYAQLAQERLREPAATRAAELQNKDKTTEAEVRASAP